MYQNIYTYFTSGTGNSFRVSEWINSCSFTLNDKEENRIKEIESVDNSTSFESKDSLLAIVMPTHAFTAPWSMFKFVYSLPRSKGIHAVVIATRAGWKIGPFFMIGISGSGTFLISLILWLKGFTVKGVLSVDMPSNWIAFHWGLHPKNVKIICKRAKPKVVNFITRIFEGKNEWFSFNNLYEFICGILLAPVTVMYLLVGRFFLAKINFANLECNSCGLCEKNCPTDAIVMKKGVPFWTYKCESCMRCMGFCPNSAIETSHPWAVILYLLTTIPVFTYILNYFGQKIIVLESLLNFIYIYPTLFLSYYVFYFLVRIPIINKIFTCSTFTHYFRRYRAPCLKNFKVS